MARKMKSMDGNTAAAHVSYAFTEVAGIYPITPSSTIAELVDQWAAAGMKNIFGQPVRVMEMQSEAGAAGVVHGSLAAGALTTTYTASQGLLLMVPNMYKIAGELLPCVIHCTARTLATHALSIFGDHSDVMACRQTGFALLASTNPQEVMDLGALAHLATLKSRIPFLHFFDGFRTSHEIQKIEAWDYKTLESLLDKDALKDFRDRALNPEHPVQRGSAQNPDIFFQAREASNPFYMELPAIVEEYMEKINELTGSDYKLFNYYGHPEAERVIVAMGSVCDTIEETIDYMIENGEKVGLIKVRLYRPFVTERFLSVIPRTCKKMSVLDRTKEPGAIGEPLWLDVITALNGSGLDIEVLGGRYGLGSKDTTPASIFAVYANMNEANPKRGFSVGIVDDVTNLSLPLEPAPDTTPKGTISCKFWGLGGDGTVGANKNSIKIIGDHTDMYSQAYFAYDSKKTSGVTISHLRFGKKPIKSTYYVSRANFVACHTPSYIHMGYDMVQEVVPGGTFLLNCQWSVDELETHLPPSVKAYIAKNNINFYIVDAITKAREIGLGKRTNTILQSAFFSLANIIPMEDAVKYMKDAARRSFERKGENIVKMNYDAIDAGVHAVVKVDVPEHWALLEDEKRCASCAVCPDSCSGRPDTDYFADTILRTVAMQKGDSLPVSAFAGNEDGTFPLGLAAFEKRGIAIDVPQWIPENCIQCNQCSYVCPHAVIRTFALDEEELANAPEGYQAIKPMGRGMEDYKFAITVSQMDCTGCGLCAITCPAKNKALEMKPIETQLDKQKYFDYAVKHVSEKETPWPITTIKGSQFKKPLLEFSGACAGCVETTYARLVTQLYGDRMYIANATGCSSIWGFSAPSTPYTVNARGQGPAWSNSLFEDNAEYGLGMALAVNVRRAKLAEAVQALASKVDGEFKEDCENWIAGMDDAGQSKLYGEKILAIAKECKACGCNCDDECKFIIDNADMLTKKSIWIFGGDGWAYDIGFGGLDHVIASGEDVNIFVFDTEVYSNTGGQASKASQTGQVAQFAAAGKEGSKKDLAAIAMSYGNVYVAQVGVGADQNQTIKAIVEAESYKGPSLIIGYSPCEMHGIKGGMGNSHLTIKAAVAAGYWHLFRFDPRKKAEGKNPFTLDSREPVGDYQEFIKREARYTALQVTYPDRAEELFATAEKRAKAKYEMLKRKVAFYEEEQQ